MNTTYNFEGKEFVVLSQNPNIAGSSTKLIAEKHYLPVLIRLWNRVEMTTQFRWKCTSYWRDSPSHRTGAALDLAPDISSRDEDNYAVTHRSDPVLYKRSPLIRLLQNMATHKLPTHYHIGVFIEPDHLHVQLFRPASSIEEGTIQIFKWKGIKPCYPDSLERMKLPMFE